MAEHSQACVTRDECARLMTILNKTLGEDENSGMRGDVREIRDKQIADSAVRESRDKRLNRILTVLSILVALSQVAEHRELFAKVFKGAAEIPKVFSMDTVERVQAHSNLGPGEGK